jgi:hypothetical protein
VLLDDRTLLGVDVSELATGRDRCDRTALAAAVRVKIFEAGWLGIY